MLSNGFYVSLRKTSVIKVSDKSNPLPPDMGPFEEFKVADYPGCPKEWSKDGIFVPVKEGEPLWFDFRGNPECAVICSVQRLNPVTGEPANLESGLSKDPKQNYLVLPEQMWLDGYAKDGKVYQFIITKAGVGLAVNEYVLPKHMQDSHAIGFAFYPPKVERKPVQPTWFSPTHAPSTWLTSSKKSVLRGIKESSLSYSAPTAGSSAADSDFDDSVGASIYLCSSAPEGGIAHSYSDRSIIGDASINHVEAEVEVNDITKGVEVNDITKQDVVFDKASMGMGGRITQSITTDRNTPEYYHEKPAGVLTIYLALPEQFEAIMKHGNRQDDSRKDKYVASGEINGVQVPLIMQSAEAGID